MFMYSPRAAAIVVYNECMCMKVEFNTSGCFDDSMSEEWEISI